MSCGNRFQCALKKHSRTQWQPDKPSNIELHNENQKRLNDLIKSRENIDTQLCQQTTTKSDNISYNMLHSIDNIDKPSNLNTVYTPWTIPSAQYK